MIRERDTILIIDFGSQYTQLIARRIRENRIFSLVKPHTLTMKEFNEIKPKGVILSGGPDSVTSLKKIKMLIDIRKLSKTENLQIKNLKLDNNVIYFETTSLLRDKVEKLFEKAFPGEYKP